MKKILVFLFSIVSFLSSVEGLDLKIQKGELNEDTIINTSLLYCKND